MNQSAVDLLQLVAEDLLRTDPPTYAALMESARQGCATVIQIEYGPQAQASLGSRDDYGKTRWVHAIPLHPQH